MPPGSSAPEPLGVPPFDPLRVRGPGLRLRRALRRRHRAMAAGLAMTAAALAASAAGGAAGTAGTGIGTDSRPDAAAAGATTPPPWRQAARMVSAPVRIADAAAVRLLRRGDRVDVIAAGSSTPAGRPGEEPGPRVVAAGARVTEIPEEAGPATDSGALIVLSVPRATATELAGAGATSQLAVTVC